MSAECKATCDAKVIGKLECTPARVALKVEGAADARRHGKYKARDREEPPGHSQDRHRHEGSGRSSPATCRARRGCAGLGQGGGCGQPDVVARLSRLASPLPFKGALDAAASIKANVNVSVDVKASAEASGSASGKAG